MAIVVSCFVLPNEKPNPCNLGTHISEGKASSVRVLLDLPSNDDACCGAGPSRFFHGVLFIDFCSISTIGSC
jgi:hypothetical protein